MTEQYIWLHKHLDDYQYNTVEAKELYATFKSVVVAPDGQIDEATGQRLKELYEKFADMFGNNPYMFQNGLCQKDIETDCFKNYFVETSNGILPIGFFQETRPVESAILLNKLIEKNKNDAVEEETKVVRKLGFQMTSVSENFENIKEAKKASYTRAFLASLASGIILWYTAAFLYLTNSFAIVKGIFGDSSFLAAAEQGMSNLPILTNAGALGWIPLLMIHFCLIVYVLRYVIGIKKEYSLAYQRHITAGFKKNAEDGLGRINEIFPKAVDETTGALGETARQCKDSVIKQNEIAKILKRLRYMFDIAKNYFMYDSNELRGIKRNKTIVILILAAFINCFAYTAVPAMGLDTLAKNAMFDLRVSMDNMFLRGRKMVFVSSEECPVYKRSTEDSQMKATLEHLTEVEVVDTKEKDGVLWFKIKKFTESELISGWIVADCTTPCIVVDTELYDEFEPGWVDATSHLVGSQNEYFPEYAVDGNRETSWQDGDDSNGENETLTLYFDAPVRIDAIQIFPGNASSEELFYSNCRIKKAKLRFSNGDSITYKFDDTYYVEYQTIWLNKPVNTEYIEIEMLDVYEGEYYTDLCVSEICTYGKLEE